MLLMDSSDPNRPNREGSREWARQVSSRAVEFESAQDETATFFEEMDSLVQESIAVLFSRTSLCEKTALSQLEKVRALSLKSHGNLEKRTTVCRQHSLRIITTMRNPKNCALITPPFTRYAHATITSQLPSILSEVRMSIPKEMYVFMQLPTSLHALSNIQPDWIQGAAFPLIPGDVATIAKSAQSEPIDSPSLQYPYGLDVHPLTHDVYVVDQENSVIRVYDKNLRYILSFGALDLDAPSEKSAGVNTVDGVLDMPWGISISADGERIGVTCVGTSEIHLFNRHHQRIRVISRSSHPQLSLEYIHMLAFDRDGFIYVTDTNAGDLIKFAPTGDYIKHIVRSNLCVETGEGAGGSGNTIESPEAVTFNHQNELLVLGLGGDAVHVLTPDGVYIRSISVEPCSSGTPSVDLCRGPGNGFAISDWAESQVRFYAQDGTKLAAMTADYPLGISFSPNGRFYFTNYLSQSITMCAPK